MIRFKRYPNRTGLSINWTTRRESFAKSKPKRHAKKAAKKIPLFSNELMQEADEVVVDVDSIKAELQNNADSRIQRCRDFEAKTWRKARKAFFECDIALQEAILDKWNNHRNHAPRTSVRFAGLIDVMSGEQARRLKRCEQEFQEYCQRKEILSGTKQQELSW